MALLARNYLHQIGRSGARWQASDMIGGTGITDNPYGKVYWCMKSTDDQYDRFLSDFNVTYADGNDAVQTSLTTTLALVKPYDTIFLSAGDWTGNYTTQANADAPWVSIIGTRGTWMGATTASSPIITVNARGMRFSGIEFDGGSGAAALKMISEVTRTNRGADFFEVDNCLFFGGQGGIDFAGGGTYWNIHDNQFSLITTSGKAGIWVSDSSFQLPALGKITNNDFDNNINHVHVNSKGFNDVKIKGNQFMQDSNGQNATVLLDISGSGGGNIVSDNFFDCTVAQYEANANAFVQGNSTDSGQGNHCSDGNPGYDGTASVFGA